MACFSATSKHKADKTKQTDNQKPFIIHYHIDSFLCVMARILKKWDYVTK
jgi:hypothetical protein